jgi:hypothetical protein
MTDSSCCPSQDKSRREFANSSIALCKSGQASKRRAVTLAKTWDGKRFHRALQSSLPLRRRSTVLPQATACHDAGCVESPSGM